MNTAIIVAAGSGTRFGSETPKQFLEINGRPVVAYSIDRFAESGSVDEIVVVVPSAEVTRFEGKYPQVTKVVAGGRTRAESVRNGLGSISVETGVVAVHDGARPLVSVKEINSVISAAVEFGAACLVGCVTDTIKEYHDGLVTGTLDRRTLRRALTPQAFRAEILHEAFASVETDESITDECSLVERLGHEIAAVQGSPRNIKITHPDDLKIAELFLR
jgi:2-C-methyl-D-erythritol 4-phosphate cytidylyltransferase